MKSTLLAILWMAGLTGCMSNYTRYYYETPVELNLQQKPSDQAKTITRIRRYDTVSTDQRITPKGKFIGVRYNQLKGYIKPTELDFLFAARPKSLHPKVPKPVMQVKPEIKPSHIRVVDEKPTNLIGFGAGYSTNQTLRGDWVLKLGKQLYKAGYSYQFGGQQGKHVTTQLSNYGRTIIGRGSYLNAINLGYGYEFRKNLVLEGEFSVGWQKFYVNFQDNRFNGGGYYLVESTQTVPGGGVGLRYIFNDYVNVSAGFNTLMGINAGLYFSGSF